MTRLRRALVLIVVVARRRLAAAREARVHFCEMQRAQRAAFDINMGSKKFDQVNYSLINQQLGAVITVIALDFVSGNYCNYHP